MKQITLNIGTGKRSDGSVLPFREACAAREAISGIILNEPGCDGFTMVCSTGAWRDPDTGSVIFETGLQVDIVMDTESPTLSFETARSFAVCARDLFQQSAVLYRVTDVLAALA